MSILPAHATKNTPILHYPLPPPLHQTLHLTQDSTTATTTGSTLWLGAQVLTLYLYTLYPPSPPSPRPRRALDLGAGTGLTTLALAAAGWHVTSTDVSELISPGGVLHTNLLLTPQNTQAVASGGGSIVLRELDWLNPPPAAEEGVYNLIVSSDTLYEPSLTRPLLETVRARTGPGTVVLIALEVRDAAVIAGALEMARGMGFTTKRVPPTRLRKVLGAAKVMWGREEWEGVEVWRLGLK